MNRNREMVGGEHQEVGGRGGAVLHKVEQSLWGAERVFRDNLLVRPRVSAPGRVKADT